jgi:hypothetical protein
MQPELTWLEIHRGRRSAQIRSAAGRQAARQEWRMRPTHELLMPDRRHWWFDDHDGSVACDWEIAVDGTVATGR